MDRFQSLVTATRYDMFPDGMRPRLVTRVNEALGGVINLPLRTPARSAVFHRWKRTVRQLPDQTQTNPGRHPL